MPGSSREIAAAVGALAAYASTVLPRVRRELRRWGPLPQEKVANAEAVAVFATLAPRSARATVVRAIVALQVAIDLRDEGEETGEPADGEQLERLEQSWRGEVARLPALEAVEPLLRRAVERCEEGQRRTHAAAGEATEPLWEWARAAGAAGEYRWWEVAAGASSSVAAHALIAAAGDQRTTPEQAAAIDAAYNPGIGALTVLLDDLVDLEEDRAGGEHNYVGYYGSRAEAAERLAWIIRRSEESSDHLPRSSRHRAILAGVVAFYLSQPEADLELGPATGGEMLTALGPGARFLTAFLRLRRLAGRRRSGQAGNSPGP